jgi:sulfur-oxidizing protein SoxY
MKQSLKWTAFTWMIASGLAKPQLAFAQWNAAGFNAKNFKDALSALAADDASTSQDISWGSTPEIAENGAVVPITVASTIANTESIAILADKNPFTLAALFDIPPGTEPAITTRIRVAQSSQVHALVKAGGKYYVASKDIKVTVGGCGG